MKKDQEYNEDNWNKKVQELGLNPNSILKGESATQEEIQSEHDAWWDSLTNEDKEKLYEEAERAEEERIERELDDRAWSDEIE